MITVKKRMCSSDDGYKYTVIADVNDVIRRVSSGKEDRAEAEAECMAKLEDFEGAS